VKERRTSLHHLRHTTLGLGGVTSASGSHTGPNGETFVTTLEGDVTMNKGVANCSLLFNNGDFNSAHLHDGPVAGVLELRDHESLHRDGPEPRPPGVGPTRRRRRLPRLRLDHLGSSDRRQRARHGIDSDPHHLSRRLRCHLVPDPAPLRGNGSDPDGYVTTTSYTDNSVSANTAYLYAVAAVSSGGTSPNSSTDPATTVIHTDNPLQRMSAYPYTDSASPGVVIKAVHIHHRAALRAGRCHERVLGLTTGGWTNPTLTAVIIKAVHFQEIRNRMK
jgi:hypothetical protein